MKTKNILLPAIALLAGTLLSAPAYAQLSGDYHDDLESIRQDIKIEVPTQIANQKSYLNVQLLHNQMNEDLPIDYEKLFKAASNSIKDNKVSAQDQYELMVFAIQMNHNKVLETLLKAGFKANIDVELAQAGTEVSPLAEIAQAFNNTEALKLIETYMPKMIKRITPKKIERLKNIEKRPHGEYMYKIDKKPAATATIKVVSDTIPEQEEGIIGASYYNEHGTLVIKKFDKPLSDAEYQQWLKNNETMQRIHKNKVTEEKYKQMLDSIKKSQNK